MMPSLRRLWAQLLAQPRALAGLAVLIVLGWLVAVLEADERLAGKREEASRLARQLNRLHGVAAEAHWPATRDAQRARLGEFRARAWREESEGRIQARLQDWLRDQLAGNGLKTRELVVTLVPVEPAPAVAAAAGARLAPPEPAAGAAPVAPLPADMRLARARVTVEFTSDAFTAFLAKLSAQDRWLWVERILVRNHPRNRVAELELAALFVVGVKEPAP